ncbi:hypothetical protein AWN76_011465 [Rhodothermaceae bacterium RA]|nr:hypothetical protein AWN76_011465 [Rhodothermaceae bacterium RA]
MTRRPFHSVLLTAGRLGGLVLLLALAGRTPAARAQGALPPDFAEALSQHIHEAWTIEDGLPQNTVNALAQTPDGYLWLGTEEGLVRFNGLSFVVFDGATAPIFGTQAHVRTLAVDTAGTLWIGAGGKLIRYDGTAFTLAPLPSGPASPDVTALYVDAEGTLWVGTSGGVFRRSGEGFEAGAIALPSPRVTAIHRTRDGTLWIGTDAGLVRVRGADTTVFTEADGLPDAFIHMLHEDAQGTLWIGTRGGVRHLRDGVITPEAVPGALIDVPAFAFRHDSRGHLWIGTDGDGLYVLRAGRLEHLSSRDGLPSDRVVTLFEDREASLWFGTEGGGLHRLRKSKFVTLDTAEGLSHDMVLSVYEDSRQTLWVGTEGGLNRIREGRVTTYTTADGLPSDVILSLQEGPDGALWIGTYGGGLSRLHEGCFTTHTVRTGFLGDAVFAMHRGGSGVLWIGTDAGVARYDGAGFSYLTQADGLSSNQITALYEDHTGALWIGTFDAGLNRYHQGTVTTYTSADGLGGDAVMALFEDHTGALWVGTYGGGLTRIRNGRLHTVTAEHGLFSNTIYQILEDEANHLWMSSNKGLFRVSLNDLHAAADHLLDTLPVEVFGRDDGLRSREMNGGVQPAGWKGRDGTLWFPTIRGVAGINPARAWRNTLPPPVALEALLVDREPVALDGPLRLAPGARKIELHYAALTLVNPAQVTYRYRLEGYDEEWAEAGRSRTATYTNLPPGHYTFRVMARNSDGVWSTEAATLTFYLEPFLYQHPLFWIVMALLLASMGGLAYRLRVHQLKARQQELEAQVEARTADLREAKERIERQAEQLKELDRFKTRFFANISHEFRTPLTLMIGPLENALSGAYGAVGDTLGEQLQVMLRNAMRLLRLINQLLDLSRLESGKMTLRPRPRNLIPFLDGIVASFSAFAEQKQIALTLQTPTDHLELYYEPDKLEKVFFNLLSNAVKYTPKGGAITVSVEEQAPTEDAPDGTVQVRVRDTGPGIPADHLPYVFDRFHRVDDSDTRQYEGTGIGLALVKELVLLHGGTVEVASEPGHGATFTVTLRKGSAHFAPDLLEPAPADQNAEDDADEPLAGPGVDPGALAEMATADLNDMARGDHAPTNVPAPPSPSTPELRPRILVVDDNADIRAYVRSCIQDLCEVFEAVDGQHGLEQATTLRPDLIISDIMMPRMNGYEFCGRVKADPDLNHIPVILLSAKTSQQTILQGLEVGADEYLAKPFNARELRIRIQNLLKLRAQERALKAWNEHLQEKVNEQLALILREREAYEARLLAEKEKAEEVARLKTTILNNLSHEFRTPITGIIGSADILAMELESADMQELVGFIQANGKRLMDTLTALLELAHLESNAARPRPRPLPVVDVVRKAVEPYRLTAQRRGLEFRFQPTRPDLQATLDAELVTRVVQVLVDNAIKFTREGGVTVEVDERDAFVYLRVSDTGIGIGEAFLPHVFEAFRQESDGDSRSHEGTGLGLTIAKRLVDLMNGVIKVRSARGRGSVFTVRLPVAGTPAPEAEDTDQAAPAWPHGR